MPLIIFDLDGTVIDSRLDLAYSTNEVIESYGASPLPIDTVAGMVGEGAAVLVARALSAAGLDPGRTDALDRFKTIYDRRMLDETRPYDGIDAVLATAAARAPLAILTNKPEAPARHLLDAFGLASHFTWIVGADSGFPRKPDPASTHDLMRRAGASARDTLFVGDSMIDVETARRAGVPVCVARYGFGYLRGELALRGDESIAITPAEAGVIIDRFLRGLDETRSDRIVP